MNGRMWAALIAAGWLWVLLQASFHGDPDDWFVVGAIHVDDVELGQEPVVRYDRWIKQDFRGTWSVEINEVTSDGFQVVCSSTGGSNYKPTDVKPAAYPLAKFIGRACPLEPGKSYSVDAIWTIRPANLPPMEIARTSNTFHVREARPPFVAN
jgi:hypothetical protein